MPEPAHEPLTLHHWCARVDPAGDAELRRDVALLSAEEQERHGRYQFDRDRRSYALAHGLLRRALSTCRDVPPAAWEFARSENGKPHITAPHCELAFSLSHSHGLVACAVGEGMDIGIDVESADRVTDADELAKRYFTAQEVDDLSALPPAERQSRFIELWTLKEAYLKAIGVGLSARLDTVGFSIGADGQVEATLPPDAGSGWTFSVRPAEDMFRVALAVRTHNGGPVRIVEGPRC